MPCYETPERQGWSLVIGLRRRMFVVLRGDGVRVLRREWFLFLFVGVEEEEAGGDGCVN